jgi:Domain of unknown function (DUF4286)
MILYNVTVSIDESIHLEWLDWMKSTHVPDVMATGCFKEARISRVHGEEEGGFTFAMSYVCPSQEIFDEYQKSHAPLLQQEHNTRYSGKVAAFRTMLTILEEFKA